MGGTLSSWGITGIFAEEVNFQRDLGNGWPAKVGGAAWSAGRGGGGGRGNGRTVNKGQRGSPAPLHQPAGLPDLPLYSTLSYLLIVPLP